MDAKFYIKGLNNPSNQNEENQNENELFKSIINDIFIDVGEAPESQFKEIDEELSNKIFTKGLLLKSGDYYYPRTSDYLVDNGRIVSSAVAALAKQDFTPYQIYGVFGTVTWNYNDKEVGGESLIVLFTYQDNQGYHFGLLWVEF